MQLTWTFFVDRSCGSLLVPEALRLAGEAVEVHDDHFEQDTPDEIWLPVVSRLDRLVITKDSAIAKNRIQRLLVASNGTRLFALTSATISGPEMAEAFSRAVPSMRRLADRTEPPFIVKVYRDGKASLWKNSSSLLEELKSFRSRRS